MVGGWKLINIYSLLQDHMDTLQTACLGEVSIMELRSRIITLALCPSRNMSLTGAAAMDGQTLLHPHTWPIQFT